MHYYADSCDTISRSRIRMTQDLNPGFELCNDSNRRHTRAEDC